jgi:hypothetical protein
MENQSVSQVENKKFKAASHWLRNRSKYMVLRQIDSGFQPKAGGFVATLPYILINVPVPLKTLQASLPKWVKWKYIQRRPNGAYSITGKGLHFLLLMDTHYRFIVNEWLQDIDNWRAISKDCAKTPDGKLWLPYTEFIRALDNLLEHRIGTSRCGTGAGRPQKYQHCLVCKGKYPVFLPECPECKQKAERAARIAARMDKIAAFKGEG